jgi:hypothetical protein
MPGTGGKGDKSTSPLRMICHSGLAENRFNIHPNDGFDLGFMTTHYAVETSEGQAEVWLLNECPQECVQINPKAWERLGKPAKAVLSYDGKILRIEKA